MINEAAMESSVNGGAGVSNSTVDVAGGFSQSQMNSGCGGENGEEELSVLPRHTKVIVTGNNRTKSVLVGLQGVVKKAVGLGGWHWLVLTNGIEVKLQRNALSVIEAPTGNEEDDDFDSENGNWNGLDMAASKYDNERSHISHRPRHGTPKPPGPGSSHKVVTSCRRSYDSHYSNQPAAANSAPSGSGKVDLSKLEVDALWRYSRHFNLVETLPNPSREQLIDVVQRHFMSQQMDEQQVIAGFIQSAKRLKAAICK
ncbi:hypothetical protein Dimus_025579 [Dionaea muscipula]